MATPVKEPATKRAKGDEENAKMGESPTNIDIDAGDVNDIDGSNGLAPQRSGAQGSGVAAGPAGALTLEAIGYLMDQKLTQNLHPISKSIDQILEDLTKFKESVRKELNTLGLRITSLEKETSNTSDKVSWLEREVEQLKLRPNSVNPQVNANTNSNVVIGNIPGGGTFEAAQEWVKKHCEKASLIQPNDMFFKSDFNGIVFAKCDSVDDRDRLITSITQFSKRSDPGNQNKVWAKLDQPLDIRTAKSCLLRMKWMLVEGWGYNKSCIKVDTEANPPTLSVANKEIVTAMVQDHKLVLRWSDGEWESWDDLQSAGELAKIKSELQDKLSKAKEMSESKGKGKRPSE
jgi:hypothetical protein